MSTFSSHQHEVPQQKSPADTKLQDISAEMEKRWKCYLLNDGYNACILTMFALMTHRLGLLYISL